MSETPSDTPTEIGAPTASASTEDTIAAGPPAPYPKDEPVARGQTLGRYMVVERLGSGAMGVVYAAYDPELDRKVALKLLQVSPGGSSQGSSGGSARLVREAQAMAALSHPNVITVHDVGTLGDEVFVAMEFVDGWTLKEWLRVEKRSVAQILEVGRAAGRGLAAAHAAGLVHRDFKPDNVMVGRDGRVRVMDFGLARKVKRDAGSTQPEPAADSKPLTQSLAGKLDLTQTGAILGTPAYMSAEQHLGQEADARSDQFSFCVALYEALYGERPFAGESPATIAFQIHQGKIRDEKHSAYVPRWVRKVLVRGLATRPENRWPDMEALLQALSADPTARLLKFGAIGAVALVAGVGAYAYSQNSASVCTGGEEQLAEVWSEDRRAAIETRMAETGRGHAADTSARVAVSLDSYASSWLATHRDACEATQVRGEQSAELMDLRMSCLRDRLESLRAVTELFAEADGQVVDRAVDMATDLPGLAQCSDTESLTAVVKPPADARTREEVVSVRDELAQLRALAAAGRYADGVQRSESITDRARETAYPPVLAEALFWRGRLQTLAGDHPGAELSLLEAGDAAAEGRDDHTAAAAWTALVRVIGAEQARPAEGLLMARVAQAALSRSGAQVDQEADLAASLAAVHQLQAKYDEARAELERSLALRKEALGETHPKVARTELALGDVARASGDYDRARAHYLSARELLEGALGDGHPEVARAYNSAGNVMIRTGKYEDAIELHEKALAIREAALGPEHPDVAASLNNLGAAHENLRQFERAIQRHTRAMQIRKAALGDQHPKVAMSLNNIGNVHHSQGHASEALSFYEQALAIKIESLGDEHPSTGETLGNISNVYRNLDEFEKAVEYGERSLQIFVKVLGDDHPNVGSAYTNQAGLLAELERYEEALEYAKRAREVFVAKLGPDAPRVGLAVRRIAHAQFELDQRTEGVASVRESIRILHAAGKDFDEGETRHQLARMLWTLGERKEAAREGRRALELMREHGDAAMTDAYRKWLSDRGL